MREPESPTRDPSRTIRHCRAMRPLARVVPAQRRQALAARQLKAAPPRHKGVVTHVYT